ncbi:hypothetical protein ACQ4WX_18535 [Streptomyces lasalocidi]
MTCRSRAGFRAVRRCRETGHGRVAVRIVPQHGRLTRLATGRHQINTAEDNGTLFTVMNGALQRVVSSAGP